MSEVNNNEPKTNGKKKIFIGLGLVVLIAAGGFFGYTQIHNQKVREVMAQDGIIYPNIDISSVDVSGLTKKEALMKVKNSNMGLEHAEITLKHESETWNYSYEELGGSFDLDEAVTQAYEYGRTGTDAEQMKTVSKLLRTNITVPLPYKHDEAVLDGVLAELGEEFNQEMENSSMTRQNGKFVITEEKEGLALDVEATKKNVLGAMEAMQSGTATMVVEIVEPEITYEDNENVTDLLGSFSTKYSSGDVNRNTNLVVGCEYINGTIIAPGEVFSAAEGLGDQTYDRGYRNAGVYVNGKVEAGMGGGVCQITTTLYNAAIFAELEIVERHAHSMTVGYVPLGRDAAIADYYKDLRIKNDTEFPIYIEAYASGGTLAIKIFGKESRSAGRTVEFSTVYEGTIAKPEEIVKEDPEKPEGEREVTHNGRTGSKVSVYKTVYSNGKQVSKDWFSSSSYRAVADEVTVGTKPLEEDLEVINTGGWTGTDPVDDWANSNTDTSEIPYDLPRDVLGYE